MQFNAPMQCNTMQCTNAAMQAAVMYFTVINCLALQGTYDNCSDKSSDFCHFFVQFLAFWEFVLELPFQGIIGGLFWGPSRAHRRTPSTAQCVLCTVFSPPTERVGTSKSLSSKYHWTSQPSPWSYYRAIWYCPVVATGHFLLQGYRTIQSTHCALGPSPPKRTHPRNELDRRFWGVQE